ncbi:DUF1064 domain-containing protein [Enterococcus sp. AZ101]|uniref:DUF1064 domain-containing protein n=1 Tax=Enterococcus sp. AZ101 TaxID=2774742 RepID=UPI003D2C1936
MNYPIGVRRPTKLKQQQKQNKYKNKKTIVDGITFDSKAEAAYYYQLKQQGITNFKMQESFVIHDAFSLNGKRYQAIKYKPDFTFYEGDQLVKVIDVKGKRTADFNIKAKMFAKRYGVPIKLAIYDYKNRNFAEVTA